MHFFCFRLKFVTVYVFYMVSFEHQGACRRVIMGHLRRWFYPKRAAARKSSSELDFSLALHHFFSSG